MLAPDGSPLRKHYFFPKDNRALEREEIVKGYEVEKNRYVMVTDDELEALEPVKSREIDLRRFVPSDAIDPMYFDRAYFFAPTGDSKKPYRLLAEVMEKTRRAGIATFVMRSKEYFVAILSENGILRAETLRFSDELRTPEDVGLPKAIPAPASAVKQIIREIRAAAVKKFDTGDLKDQEAERLLALIQKKKAAGEGVIHPPEAEDNEREEDNGNVINIMDILKRSLARADSKRGKSNKTASGESASMRELEGKNKKELYEYAKELNVPGRSDMDKDELTAAIRKAQKH
jgi:DNA end-binding protein Ku